MAKRNPSLLGNIALLGAAAAGAAYIYSRVKKSGESELPVFDRNSFNCDIEAMIENGADPRVVDSIIDHWNRTGTGRDPCTVPTDSDKGMQLQVPGSQKPSSSSAIDRCAPFLADGAVKFDFGIELPKTIPQITKLVKTINGAEPVPYAGTVIAALSPKEPDLTYVMCNVIRMYVDQGSDGADKIRLFRKKFSTAEAQTVVQRIGELVDLFAAIRDSIVGFIPGSAAAIANIDSAIEGMNKLQVGVNQGGAGTIASISIGPTWNDFHFVLGAPVSAFPSNVFPASDSSAHFTLLDTADTEARLQTYAYIASEAVRSTGAK